MTDFTALASEINVDPLGRGYSGMTDEQVTIDINTKYRVANYPIELDLLNFAIRDNGKWTPFREAADLQTIPGTYDNQAMREFMDLFGTLTVNTQYDMQSAYMTALRANMVSEGSMTAPISSAINDLGIQTVSRAVELELGSVQTGDVIFVRAQ
jgi:hypothetical protein